MIFLDEQWLRHVTSPKHVGSSRQHKPSPQSVWECILFGHPGHAGMAVSCRDRSRQNHFRLRWTSYNFILVGGILYLPLWKIWVRQLGWWNSQLNGKYLPLGKMMEWKSVGMNIPFPTEWKVMKKSMVPVTTNHFYFGVQKMRLWNKMRALGMISLFDGKE